MLDLQIIDQALDKKIDSSGRLADMPTAVLGALRLYARF
jgi:hypothetical protein